MSDALYLRRELKAAGVSRRWIRTALGRNALTRVCRGVYAAAGDGDRLRDLRALFARLPPAAVLGYGTAAAIHGFQPERPGAPVHVIVPSDTVRPRIQGVICHEAVLPVSAPVMVAGVPCAPAARCAVDLARAADRPTGLAILDAALRAATCTAADLVAEVDRHTGLRGVGRVRGLVNLADGRAGSVPESHLRLVIVDGGLPAPEAGLWVDDGTGHRGYRIALAYRGQKIGLDYEGRPSLTERLADGSRLSWLTARGWTMRTVTDSDLYQSSALIVAEVRALLSRPAARQPDSDASILQLWPHSS